MIKAIKSNLSLKVFMITFVLLMSASMLTYLFISWTMPITYKAAQSEVLSADAEALAAALNQHTLEESAQLLEEFSQRHSVEVQLSDNQGNLLTPAKDKTFDSKYNAFLLTDDLESIDIAPSDEIDTAVGFSFTFKGDSTTYTLIAKGSMKAVNQAVEALKKTWPWLVLSVFIISILSSWFYSRYLTRPIVQISAIARKMSELEFDWRCDDKRRDEIGSLGGSLNELSERLSEAMNELKRTNQALQADIDRERELEEQRLAFFTAVSHELKTPLTVLKGQLEGMSDGIGVYADRDKYLRRSLGVVNRMEELVAQIVAVSKMEKNDFDLQKDRFDLSLLCRECIEACHELALSRHAQWECVIEEELMVVGNRALMQKALDNILCNAIVYSPMHAKITVRVYQKEHFINFECVNSDTEIPAASLPHLFEAFYRVEQSRSRSSGGSGLGLYLVKLIADAHHAQADIQNTAKGVCFTLSFPSIMNELKQDQ